MPRDFFDPTPEDQVIVFIESTDLRRAEKLIESCEHCNPKGAEIPFDAVLDRVNRIRSQRDGLRFGAAAKCPNCRREILEKTLVEPA